MDGKYPTQPSQALWLGYNPLIAAVVAATVVGGKVDE